MADRYEILEQIGTGGMSDVYRAKCHKLNRFVAIKVLKKEYSEDKTFVSKFRAEAQAAAPSASTVAAEAQAAASEPTEVSRQAYDDCDGSGHGYYEITYSDGSVRYEEY